MTDSKSIKSGRERLNSDELPTQSIRQPNCVRQSLPSKLGEGRSLIFQLDPALSYIDTQYQPTRDLAIATNIEFREPKLVVTLGIAGQTRFVGRNGAELTFSEGYTTITSFDSSNGERQYQANKNIKQLRFSIGQPWLARYLGDHEAELLFKKNTLRLLACQPTAHQSSIAARQLLNCNINSRLAPLLINGQAQAILASELDKLCRPEIPGHTRLSPASRQLAEAARDILAECYQNPPSVDGLANTLGVTPFKLKNLFQHYFNNTPYGVLIEIRMQHAYRLLESTRLPISAISESVGYRHPGNFSVAFSKYFGISPKQVSRKH